MRGWAPRIGGVVPPARLPPRLDHGTPAPRPPLGGPIDASERLADGRPQASELAQARLDLPEPRGERRPHVLAPRSPAGGDLHHLLAAMALEAERLRLVDEAEA